jgi:hypothetical protein
VTDQTARDRLIAYATTTRTVTADGLDPLLDAVLAEAAVPSAVPAHAVDQAGLREQIAAAIYEHMHPGSYWSDTSMPADWRPTYLDEATAVLAVLPAADRAAEEAYRLAVSAALRLGTGATWEAIRDRAEDLTAEAEGLTEAGRRILDQQRVTGESTDLPAILRWAADHLATIANATPGEDVRQPGMQDAIDRLRWLAVEAQQQTETPCGPAPDQCDPETGEPCDVHEVERAHAEGDHEHCGKECEVAMPSEQLRNAILCRAIPGSAGMLDELLRRAAVVPAGAGEDPAHETREAEDPARIDRLRPEFFEHASVEAIDSQIRRAETQQRSWGDRAQTMAILRQARVKQKELGDWPAVEAQQPKEAENPRAVCVCGHTKGEHITVSGRLLCDACDGLRPDACKEFEAL